MKKTFLTTLMALLLCVSTVFGLASCGTSQEDIDNAVSEATAPLNEQIAQLNKDIADKEAKITTLESEKSALTTDKATLEAEITTLETEVATLTSAKTELETQVEMLTARVAALEASEEANETEIAELEAAIASKNSEIATLNSTISTLTTEKTNLAARVSELEASITEKDGQIATLNTSVAELQSEKVTLENRVAELESKVSALENCLKEIHEFDFTDNDDRTHTADCKHCDKTVIEAHQYDETTRLCLCGSILYVKSTINGNTQTLEVFEGATVDDILYELSIEKTTIVVKGTLTDEQYQTVIDNRPANAAVLFADLETNNYVASNGTTYTCVIGSESEEKYVLIVNELKSYQWTGNTGGGQYDVYLNQLTTQTPGARAILYDEAAWSKYQEMFVANCPTPDEDYTVVYLLLGNTGWTYYKPSTAEWYDFRTWYGSRTSTHYWYPVFDVPLS